MAFILMMLDGVLTHIFVLRYDTKIELNPIARWVMENLGMTAFHIQKIALSALGVGWLWYIYRAEGMTKLLFWAVLIVVVAYAYVVYRHFTYL